MPVTSATAEMPFSVLRRLKAYVRSNMKNDRLSSLGLMHISTEILKWTCIKQWRCLYLLRHEGQILDNFKNFLRNRLLDQGYNKIRLIRSLKKFIFRYQYLVEIYSVSAEKIISDAFSYSENV